MDPSLSPGMHELLAPLLYVLHTDVQYFVSVKEAHEVDLGMEIDEASDFSVESIRRHRRHRQPRKAEKLDDLDPATRDLFLMNDAYGAEGELGILLSDKFMEHDAYGMFDAVMSCGVADFFSPLPTLAGLTPVREASAAIYRLLAAVDPALHSHLVELGVEPQYFALRWLRVLFGREFSLEKLLLIWDAIFSSPNKGGSHFWILSTPRGALILSMAVAMLLYLRTPLLAGEFATACLTKLVNFPEDASVGKLISTANSLQPLAINGHSFDRRSPPPQNYWEEKWEMLNKDLHPEPSDHISEASGTNGSPPATRILAGPQSITAIPDDSRRNEDDQVSNGPLSCDAALFEEFAPGDAGAFEEFVADNGGAFEEFIASGAGNECSEAIVDRLLIGTLKNLGQAMAENIEVIECFIQQGGSADGTRAVQLALEELRKIGALISDL